MKRLLYFVSLSLFTSSAAALMIQATTSVSAQGNHCDAELEKKAPADHPFKYRNRGDRCEGIYAENVRCTTLLVASLTEFVEDYDLTSGKNLDIEWTAPPHSQSVRLRVQALKPRLYYRMDTVRPAASRSYSWASGVLTALGIRKSDVGIIGWTQYAVGGTERSVYLPLRVSQQRRRNQTTGYQLILVPCRELKEVFITLSKEGPDARAGILKDGEPLRYGYYGAGQPITIPITNLRGKGIYHLQIGATLREPGSSTAEIWFYHSAN